MDSANTTSGVVAVTGSVSGRATAAAELAVAVVCGMEVDCTLLRSVVQDAWNGQYTIDHLNKTLVRFQDALANPLQQAVRACARDGASIVSRGRALTCHRRRTPIAGRRSSPGASALPAKYRRSRCRAMSLHGYCRVACAVFDAERLRVFQILEFSDAVELNELDVLRLLLQAFRMVCRVRPVRRVRSFQHVACV